MKRTSHDARWRERMNHAQCLLKDAASAIKSGWEPKYDLRRVDRLEAPSSPPLDAYEPPKVSDLMQDWKFGIYPLAGKVVNCVASKTAIHEAAHFVVAERLMGTGAIVAGSVGLFRNSGTVRVSGYFRKHEAGLSCVPLVAFYSAGVMAEMVYMGLPWTGPVICTDADWKAARAAVEPKGLTAKQSSGIHANAQKLALSVITANWARVREVAQILLSNGSYSVAIND